MSYTKEILHSQEFVQNILEDFHWQRVVEVKKRLDELLEKKYHTVESVVQNEKEGKSF